MKKAPLASVWEFIDGLVDTWRMEKDQGLGSPVMGERDVSHSCVPPSRIHGVAGATHPVPQ